MSNDKQVPFSADSGVWARSAGDFFPFIVYGQQRDADSSILYGVMGGGIAPRLIGDSHAAIFEAKRLKCVSKLPELDHLQLMLDSSDLLTRIENVATDDDDTIRRCSKRMAEAIEAIDVKAYAAARMALTQLHGYSTAQAFRMVTTTKPC